jgi:sterol desaturase/sphingolipid hydroxylase (fatty acid hydroxylase superfamily)
MDAVTQILSNIPRAYLQAFVVNGAIITLTYVLVWRVLGKRLQRWRIQLKQRADYEQLKFEIKNAFLVFLVGAFSSSVVFFLGTQGVTRIYSDLSRHGSLWPIASFFILWFIDDAWFYWVHRLLHHKALYKRVHFVHHHSIDITPFTSMSFHALEAFLLAAWIFPVSLVMPIYAPVLAIMQFVGLFNNIKAHLGYELYPAWFNKTWLRFFASSTHHNMHHYKFQGNYGLHFRLWDRLCGTEFNDYTQTFDKVKARKPETVNAAESHVTPA